jgi:hypothetical protein
VASTAQPASANSSTSNTQAPANLQVGLITVEATPRQAEQIAQAMNVGTIMLTLNPPNFSTKSFQSPQEIVDAANLFDQQLNELGALQHQIDAAKPSH